MYGVGFFVNRCLAPFMVEVTALVQEGVDLPLIDKSMKAFGMPVGPITLSGTLHHHFFLLLPFTSPLLSLVFLSFTAPHLFD